MNESKANEPKKKVRKVKPKTMLSTDPCECVVATMEDAIAITEEIASAMVAEIYATIAGSKITGDEYLQWLLDRVNNDKKWRAWSAILLLRMTTKQ